MGTQHSNASIGKRVAKLRKQKHWSQAQLAEKVGSTSKHISEIERGVTGISIDIQVLLSKHLNCSIDFLIKGDDYASVDTLLPEMILSILRSKDTTETALLLDYLHLYERIHK